MNTRLVAAALVVLSLVGPQSGLATPSSKDVDRLTSYSVLLGRAIGCGVDVSRQRELVSDWVDRKFSDNMELVLVFAQGVRHHAGEQQAGRSPDSCASVQRVISSMTDAEWQGGVSATKKRAK
jgi:hypothetical protein